MLIYQHWIHTSKMTNVLVPLTFLEKGFHKYSLYIKKNWYQFSRVLLKRGTKTERKAKWNGKKNWYNVTSIYSINMLNMLEKRWINIIKKIINMSSFTQKIYDFLKIDSTCTMPNLWSWNQTRQCTQLCFASYISCRCVSFYTRVDKSKHKCIAKSIFEQWIGNSEYYCTSD